MIKKIGIKNFRAFKSNSNFDLRPITLLVGPNSSGKSSLIKLILLLKNGINKLDFENDEQNLKSYENVLNWENDSDEIVLKINLPTNILSDNYCYEITYKSNNITNIKVINDMNKIDLVSIRFEEESEDFGQGLFMIHQIQHVKFNINHFIDIALNKQLHVNEKYEASKDSYKYRKVVLENIDISRDVTRTLNLSNLKEKYFELYEKKEWTDLELIRNFALNNEIEKLEGDRLLYEIHIGKKNISEKYREDILKIQELIFNNLKFNYSTRQLLGEDESNFTAAENIIKNIGTKAHILVSKELKKLLKNEDIIINESKLGRLLFSEKLFNADISTKTYYKRTLLGKVGANFKSLSSPINKNEIAHISANRGNQKRILLNKSDVEMDKIVADFSNIKNPNLVYLKKALKLLEIEGEIEVTRYEDYISVIHVVKDGKKIALSDIGFGFSQLIPILLKIINLMESTGIHGGKTLIIEEPEANLHPRLQSKIADLLALTINHYPNLKFIIETHSEYLIRKLQYLTANETLKPNETIIHYFNEDKHVSKIQPKVKSIEITKNGNLTDTFGPGFYDEATRLQFELLKINTVQK